MNKKKIKGGIRLQPKDIKIGNVNYKIDDITDVTYKKGSIETEEKITNGKKTFDLYKITDIGNSYSNANFILPEDITSDGDNDFECIHCGETNGVYVNITVAQKTVPVDAQPYEVSNHNSSLHPKPDNSKQNDNRSE